MPINASYEYLNAEKEYNSAQTLDEKIHCLGEMIRTAPKHKGSENLLAGLRLRLKKFLEKKEKGRSVGRSSHKTIKKEGYQVVLVGLPNSGKSSLLSVLTNARPLISSIPFITTQPELGTLDHEGVKAQLVDLPSIGSPAFDSGIVNTADCMLLVIASLDDLEKISLLISRASGTRLIVFNKTDLLSPEELRRLQERIKSKKLPALPVSTLTGFNIPELKERIVQAMHVVRIYTKEPGKPPSRIPVVLPEGSTINDVAESILKGFSARVKETRLTGPSGKFPNQRIGLAHIVKDKDMVEFHTR